MIEHVPVKLVFIPAMLVEGLRPGCRIDMLAVHELAGAPQPRGGFNPAPLLALRAVFDLVFGPSVATGHTLRVDMCCGHPGGEGDEAPEFVSRLRLVAVSPEHPPELPPIWQAVVVAVPVRRFHVDELDVVEVHWRQAAGSLLGEDAPHCQSSAHDVR